MNSPAEPAGHAVPTSVDAFYGGRFHLVQPSGRGFRAGLDALLLAASLPPERGGQTVDLGAGAGALGMAVAVRCRSMTVTLVENGPDMIGLARAGLALPENAAFSPRLRVVSCDVLGRRGEREKAGLLDGAFATIVSNPPFHPAEGRASPDALRATARAIPDADFMGGWLRTAAALSAPRACLALIVRPDTLPALLAALDGRFGDVRVVAVHSRPEKPAIRILVHARRSSRAPLSLLPPVVLHAPDGAQTALSQAISQGDATIDLGLG